MLRIFLAIVQTIKSINNIPEQGAGFLAFSFWEWSLMLGGVIFIILFCLALPEEIRSLKDN